MTLLPVTILVVIFAFLQNIAFSQKVKKITVSLEDIKYSYTFWLKPEYAVPGLCYVEVYHFESDGPIAKFNVYEEQGKLYLIDHTNPHRYRRYDASKITEDAIASTIYQLLQYHKVSNYSCNIISHSIAKTILYVRQHHSGELITN